MSDVRIAVVGAGGHMGRMLVREIAATEGCVLAGATEAAGSGAIGADAGELAGIGACGVSIAEDPLPVFAGTDAVVDFTSPAASAAHATLAAQARVVHVIGTTGLEAEHLAAL